MHLSSRTSTLIRRLQHSAFGFSSTTRAEKVREQFDVRRGYADYHHFCRQAGNNPSSGQSSVQCSIADEFSLENRGFEYLDVLSPLAVDSVVRSLPKREGEQRLKRDSESLKGYALENGETIEQILQLVLSPDVDERIRQVFGCSFLVHWLTVSLTPQVLSEDEDQRSSVSFNWHCDKGPTSHLKLLVYLNSTEQHGGTTAFVPSLQTAALHMAGHTYGW